MKVYLGFDDTDTLDSPFGTGKLVRWFQSSMPDGLPKRLIIGTNLTLYLTGTISLKYTTFSHEKFGVFIKVRDRYL
jgi:hypothetical protein